MDIIKNAAEYDALLKDVSGARITAWWHRAVDIIPSAGGKGVGVQKILEYFGFDVAVTEDSVKLPEINRFPDFPKIEKYSQETIDYLLLKLQQKKEVYGYDVKPCRKLVHLPKR